MYTKTYFQKQFWWLLALTAVVLFFRLGAAPVYILDEAKNAQCAREMWASENWVIPTFNGELRTDKPALHYWFMGISYTLFGFGEWQARLFSVLAGIGTIWISFFFVKRYTNATLGFFAALTLALSTHFLFEFRLAVPDPYLIFFTALGLFAGFSYLQEKKFTSLLLAAASLALATLAKGPVALGLPGMALLLFVLLRKKWWVFTDFRLLAAAVVYFVISVPWYYLVHVATNGDFTNGFFLEHNINRFSSEMEGHGGPFFLTIAIVLIGLLPFSVNIANAIIRLKRPQVPEIVSFSAIVAVVYVVFFSISSTKLPNYPMPCYPFAAILIGFAVYECFQSVSRWPQYAWWILLVITSILPIAGFWAISIEPYIGHLKWFALGLWVLPIAVLGAIILKKRSFGQQLWWVAAGYFLFNFYFLGVAYPAIYKENPVTKIKPLVEANETLLIAYKDYNPALNFNVERANFPIYSIGNADSLTSYCKKMSASFSGKILIISRVDKLPELDKNLFTEEARYKDLFEIPTTILLRWNGNFKN